MVEGERLPARFLREDDVLVVSVCHDRLDASMTTTLRKQLALPLSRSRHVVVDLSGVGFLDSAGVGLLLWIRGRQQARYGALHLCGVTARVRATLALVRADLVLPIFDDSASAQRAFTIAA
ncbi:hypothetical protein MYXO_03320 [Myxococcaceae bacterium]|jgi:anti-sigma B factor antagonist|nr:hypothetical protein MYXO_03320 [Myxococcaceae bacterium]